jgi:16S rRNA C1402 N4-methylase RsmH
MKVVTIYCLFSFRKKNYIDMKLKEKTMFNTRKLREEKFQESIHNVWKSIGYVERNLKSIDEKLEEIRKEREEHRRWKEEMTRGNG